MYRQLTIVVLLLLFTAYAYPDGLSSLAKVGKSQGSMAKALKGETKTFERVRKAIENARIKAGQPRDLIRKQYGEPVVIIAEENEIERWVYKPGYASFFDNNKIYLFFDGRGELESIRVFDQNK